MEKLMKVIKGIKNVVENHPAKKIADKNCKSFRKKVDQINRQMWIGFGVLTLFIIADIANDFFYEPLWLEVVLLIGTVIAFLYAMNRSELAEYGKGMIAGTQDLATDIMFEEVKKEVKSVVGDGCFCGQCPKEEKPKADNNVKMVGKVGKSKSQQRREAVQKKGVKKKAPAKPTAKKSAPKKNVKRTTTKKSK